MADWVIPCNLKYYNVEGAFKNLKRIDWKQSAKNIEIGDTDVRNFATEKSLRCRT